MECVAETGGGRCARYARGSHAECERRACGARERRQSRPESRRESAESQAEEAKAVECGYWHLWRYNPELEAEGKNPFQLDSKEPQWDKFQDYLKGEVRFASVAKQFPKEADELFAAAQENAQWRYMSYLRMLGTAW